MAKPHYLAFVDMDGVIADFVEAVCRFHNRQSPYIDNPESLGVFAMEKLWGITPKKFWEPIEGNGFWEKLHRTPEANELIKLVLESFGMENTAILTAPSMSPDCVPGKRKWITHRYPALKDRIIFCSAETKRFLAGPNRLLIDDRTENVEEFVKHGGKGILVPRPWNKLHARSGEAMAYVRQAVQELIQ